MSYSFSVKASDKDAAKILAEIELEKVVAQQPIHALDRDAILANVAGVVGLARPLGEDEDLVVSVNGYISTNSSGEAGVVSISATASVAKCRPAE